MKWLYSDKALHIYVCSNHNFRLYEGKLPEVDAPDAANCFYCVPQKRKIPA